MIQTYKDIDISNSKIRIIIDTKGDVITDATLGVFEINSVTDFNERKKSTTIKNNLLLLANYLKAGIDVNNIDYFENWENNFVIHNVPFSSDGDVRMRKVYIAEYNGHLQSAWELNFLYDYVYCTFNINDSTNEIISAQNYKSSFNDDDISDIINHVNPYQTFFDPSLLNNIYEKSYSKFGWHKDNNAKYHVTIGNNVRVRDMDYFTTESSENLYLNYGETGYNDYQEIMRYSFYTVNLIHDAFYLLGFTEQNGNMQKYNFGKEGEENDRVTVIIDNTTCFNKNFNSFMSTNPDGYIPYLVICLANENRTRQKFIDGATEILTHEYTHAVVSRLANGPYDNDFASSIAYVYGMEVCIQEGISDFFAEAFHYNPKENINRNTPFEIPMSIRNYKISSDWSINNITYSYYDYDNISDNSTHQYGQIISTILHEVFWEIIDRYPNPNKYSIWDLVYKDIDPPTILVI
ncbi:hypothetical protein PIROE2DRAFT_16272 [Piromyces sp. E2]|nr:hypothetical protein PIROE2DRAFT_16272 [Piromyces sp. E2]|eukprot:OUM58442.1 hypothetical protein PIROE2DRAFT_16272 [Piromyces sp. E2]